MSYYAHHNDIPVEFDTYDRPCVGYGGEPVLFVNKHDAEAFARWAADYTGRLMDVAEVPEPKPEPVAPPQSPETPPEAQEAAQAPPVVPKPKPKPKTPKKAAR